MFSFQGASLRLFKRLNETSFSRCFSQSLYVVESTGIEPVTSCLQGRRSPSWANPPYRRNQIHKFRFEIAISKLHCGFVSPPRIKPTSLGSASVPWVSLKWWAKMDSNHRPHDYQSCALASWAIGPYQLHFFCRYIVNLYPLNWIT